MKKGHLSKITFSCQLSKTFMNLEVTRYNIYQLTIDNDFHIVTKKDQLTFSSLKVTVN